ncbi:MAG TPA: hypothetical protein PLM07_19880 [Candidatus Rifleibacterium sp.]|nr:hypothetical protein [Candidatus Rifleibacterium sp.]HPT48149.1 hypothetical protein [Candidatus Rifleibacterium sp.]
MTRFSLRAWLVLLLALASVPGWPCSDYVHLWRPVTETRDELCGADGLASFIKELADQKLPDQKTPWLVGISPDAVVSASAAAELKSAVGMLDQTRFVWAESDAMFAQSGSATAGIWLDLVKPLRLEYIWRDENKPPFAMFRTGELHTAQIRVLAMSAERKVLLIDEFAYMFLLESDFMLPSWLSAGGVWLRRVSLKTTEMPKRVEWTLSVPSDLEDLNSTPADIKRFFFSDQVETGSKILSNY